MNGLTIPVLVANSVRCYTCGQWAWMLVIRPVWADNTAEHSDGSRCVTRPAYPEPITCDQ